MCRSKYRRAKAWCRRPERVRKDDAAAARRRPRASGCRRDLARRTKSGRARTKHRARQRAPGRFRLSGSGAVAASERSSAMSNSRHNSAGQSGDANGRHGSTRSFDSAGSSRCWPIAIPTSSPAVNNSASHSRARSSGRRGCCCWTSRFPASTASCASSCRVELASLRRQLQLTAIYVTHDPDDAEALADRTIAIRSARVGSVMPHAR